MDITAILGALVALLTVTSTIDKLLHTLGLSKLISAQVRNLGDAAVAKAKLTPGTADDRIAEAISEIAHKGADAYDRGDEQAALSAIKEIAAKRAGTAK